MFYLVRDVWDNLNTSAEKVTSTFLVDNSREFFETGFDDYGASASVLFDDTYDNPALKDVVYDGGRALDLVNPDVSFATPGISQGDAPGIPKSSPPVTPQPPLQSSAPQSIVGMVSNLWDSLTGQTPQESAVEFI